MITNRSDQKVGMDDFDLVGTKPFKLKDRPANRRMQMIDLSMFGVAPKRIIIEKVIGEHDTFVVRGFIPKRSIIET